MRRPALITHRALSAVAVVRGRELAGPIVQIPKFSTILLRDQLPMAGMIEIEWRDEKYAVFGLDLRERTSLEKSPELTDAG